MPFRVISCQRLLREHETVPKRATRGVHSVSLEFDVFEAFLAQHVCFPVFITRFLPMVASAEAKLMALKGKLKGKGKDVKGAIADILKGKGLGIGGALGKGVGGKTQESNGGLGKGVGGEGPPKNVVVETPKQVVETPKDVVETPKQVVETPKDVVETPNDVVEPPKPSMQVEENPKESCFDFIYMYATYVFDVWARWFLNVFLTATSCFPHVH